MDKPPPGVGLADAIELVRSEFQRATTLGMDASLRFTPGPVELEFEVVFGKTKEAGGGIRVWVLSIDGKAEASHARTQRLKVTLNPIDPATGKPPQISDIGTR